MSDQLERILLIDDDEPTNFLHELILKKSNRVKEIVSAPNVNEAMTLLADIDPDLIFLDINMPGLSGWDFIERFKSLPEERTKKMVVVMLTTSIDPIDREKAERCNEIRDFVSKPISLPLFEQLLSKHFHLN